MSNQKTQFHTTLRTARESAHLTQRDMAEKLNLCRSAYTYYETGRAQPDLDTLARICRILDTSADSLLGIC